MTHLYSSCRSACLSATWRFRDALLHSTLPHSWQVNNFFADWVFREFKVSPVIEVSTETQQRTSHAAAHPHNTLKPYTTTAEKKNGRELESRSNALFGSVVLVFSRKLAYVISIASIVRFLLQLEKTHIYLKFVFSETDWNGLWSSVRCDDQYLVART